MSMNENGEWPDGSFFDVGPLTPIHVPVEEMGTHPILKWAQLTGDDRKGALAWPDLTYEQRESMSGIRVIESQGALEVSLPPRVNLDFLVNSDTDEEAPPFWKGRANDLQRFYTRCTDTGFLIVGMFTAITIDGVRRYFQWAPGSWNEIGQETFLYYRDHDDTHFAEVKREVFEQMAPGAVELKPLRDLDPEVLAGLLEVTSAVALRKAAKTELARDDYEESVDDDESEDEDGEDPFSSLAAFELALMRSLRRGKEDEDYEDEDDEDDDDEDDEDGDEDDMLMTEVDAISQHGHASAIASIAHRGQTDRLGYDYIDHPARVAANFDWLDQPVEHCVAWLHDVIEDSDVTAADLLKAGMLPEIVEAVELLTRRADVADEEYYERIREHPVALAVKLADIDDNLADWRFRKLDYDTQVKLSNKYFRARQLLTGDSF